ncbi:glutamate synthase large subunit [Persicimonas caeni]|uniref:Glutamate synthase large subunit n=1 Tax=Persicimonas caeni TaxID=2292766 RepID=A0A4Y6PZF7_PERCE|nr:glutamate synthase large subunit [Persicimonas caeni]QDG53711.1 glutamate synthase large subunit [Persicimonas caeni]QED34932.1 glutamate synthase large subunit [Persicimonas caeni]
MAGSSRPQSLYESRFEHDACGVGFIANIDGSADHKTIADALRALARLKHRGAIDADQKTGDGTGVQFQVPHEFFRSEYERLTGDEVDEGELIGVGNVFLPRENTAQARRIVEHVLRRRGYAFAWREVPIEREVLGEKALATMPQIVQVIVRGGEHTDEPLDFDRRLYVMRKEVEQRASVADIDATYFVSFSCRRLVYKGLTVADALAEFYPDLRNEAFVSAYCIFHQRYSTNTFPTWSLAQPFDMLGHNGEINTILGNGNGTRLREGDLSSPIWGNEIEYLTPILDQNQSDSAQLDNVLELLTLSGRSILHAVEMLIPAAWEAMPDVDPDLKAFYEYHACINEPWDGPAAVVFSDGDIVGAKLDRNGLRPARYKVTKDGRMIVSSEVGVLDIPGSELAQQGRLGPGDMIAVDLGRQTVLENQDIEQMLSSQAPYGEWVDEHLERVDYAPFDAAHIIRESKPEDLVERQLCFGYSAEEAKFLFEPMTGEAKDPVHSMGDDTPLAVLSRLPRLLSTYFKQRFAQVTNPPIDPIREKLVMSLGVNLGKRRNWLAEMPEHADQIVLAGPVVTQVDLDAMREKAEAHVIDALFDVDKGSEALLPALNEVCRKAEAAVDAGATMLILSDRSVGPGRAPIPMLLAVGAVNSHLLRQGKRLHTSLIAESGEPREVHHFATLIGYGASAVHPYLAFETIVHEIADEDATEEHLAGMLENYREAIHKGLLKIMSKMGISVLGSYRGAQIFEAIGINGRVIDYCFPNTPSQIGGIGFEEIAKEALVRHGEAYPDEGEASVQDLGYFRFRRSGEEHGWSPKMLRAMAGFQRQATWDNYKKFAEESDNRPPIALRDLMEFSSDRKPVPLDEVESKESIRTRFTTAAMSLGSLSPEVHEAIAIAMNRIGGKSNTGEGGEDPKRYEPSEDGDSADAYIKQVASGRFGVTPEYLRRARELEIKMAQGSKPGEGGQLPGHKVTKYIATLRHSTPGVSLISPPPHHDIYSIEDLAQLIYDLKQINPEAEVVVKLVAEAGVGTIAAGVAKAYADVIQISGHDGGTGASPLSSIKNAGGPWELGLAETQQVLRLNGLRERVKLRTDGGLKTGKDIVKAAMLGAEEFNFGTAALIAIGCKYVRQCHLDTCPVGIATQREELRERFKGSPEQVIDYFNGVAEDVRHVLAALGFRTLDELVGRTDLLRQTTVEGHPKANLVDLSRLLRDPAPDAARRRTWERNVRPAPSLNDQILEDVGEAAKNGEKVEKTYRITNVSRTVGARLAGHIAESHGNTGLPEGTVDLTFNGAAGQSFGAFNIAGVRLRLVGEANDYVGKGLGGGEVIVRPPDDAPGHPTDVVAGNTCLYGATGGRAFIRGSAGERFAVRNSGGEAVVEGVGDHCCEYMTQGAIVVLGQTGKNFGAGMTGGLAYVFDPKATFVGKFNSEFVDVARMGDEDAKHVRALVERHAEVTDSPVARDILADWDEERGHFWKVIPHETAKLEDLYEEGEDLVSTGS